MKRHGTKLILMAAIILCAGTALQAQTVYFTAHGKVYHRYVHWRHTGPVYTASRATAEAHGLRACKFCWHNAPTAKSSRTGNTAWAKPEAVPETRPAAKPEKK